jgi:hypothetical protein
VIYLLLASSAAAAASGFIFAYFVFGALASYLSVKNDQLSMLTEGLVNLTFFNNQVKWAVGSFKKKMPRISYASFLSFSFHCAFSHLISMSICSPRLLPP